MRSIFRNKLSSSQCHIRNSKLIPTRVVICNALTTPITIQVIFILFQETFYSYTFHRSCRLNIRLPPVILRENRILSFLIVPSEVNINLGGAVFILFFNGKVIVNRGSELMLSIWFCFLGVLNKDSLCLRKPY